jgi:predicted acylesterase/phospholipase RssA
VADSAERHDRVRGQADQTVGVTHIPALAAKDAGEFPRRALILAGGGMRVAYQAGVLRALEEAGLRFAHADGTSGGTINLAMLLSGLPVTEMCDRWRTLNVKEFAGLMPVEDYLKAFDMIAMGSADGLVNKVFPHLGIDVPAINAAIGIAGTFNVCNFTRKVNEAVPHERVDLDLLVAGVSLPIFMPPVPKGDSLYCDSVWIKDANLMEAVRRGADELWVTWCIGNTGEYKRGIFHQYVHMIEISANGVLFEEFDRIKDINDRIRNGERVGGRTRPIVLHVIKPEYPLPLDPDFFFGRIDAATLIAMGYADACRYLAQMKPEGIAFEAEATQMKTETLGLTFRERMAGDFALGPTEPQAGADQGKLAGTTLTLHNAITIYDLKSFLSDPKHAGRLSAEIDLDPFGRNIPAKGGVFNLFAPGDRPERRVMTYELAFTHDGQDYYLAGEKHIENNAALRLWKDTTTLYTRLHRGTDTTGPVVGAGIATLGVADLVHLVSTMHATNARSTGEAAEAMADFGRFFLGELWERYGRKTE